MRSGWINYDAGILWAVGVAGYQWSQTASTFQSIKAATAYSLSYSAVKIYVSNDENYRELAFPLRCKTLSHDRVLQHINRGGLCKNFDTVIEFSQWRGKPS